MNNILLLIKIDFLQMINSFRARDRKEGKKVLKNILLGLLIIVSLAPIYIFFIIGLWSGYDIFIYLNQEIAFLQLGIIMTQFIIFIFAIPTVLNRYYFMTDVEMLIPLPLKPYEILGSKFTSLLLREYLISGLMILPFIIINGLKGSFGIVYWIYSLILLLTIPIFPLVLVSIIVMVFMRFTNLGRKKDLVRGIGLLLISVLSIVFMMVTQKLSNSAMDNQIDPLDYLVKNSNILLGRFGKFFPLSIVASRFLYNFKNMNGLLNGIIFIAIGGLGIFLILALSEKIYFNNFLEGGLVSKTEKKSKLEYNSNVFRKNSPYLAILKKELKILFKTPIYLFNSVGGSLMMPIILLISFSMDRSSRELLKDIPIEFKPIVLMAVVAVGLFLNIGNVASTSFSREGKSFWIQKHLPIRGRDQALGRSMAGIMINLLGIVLTIFLANFIIELSLVDSLLIFYLSILLSIPIIGFSLFIDISRPKLDWRSPEEAMKQNMNVLIVMGIIFLYIGLLIALNIFLFNKLNGFIIFLIMNLIGYGLSFIIYKRLIRKIELKMIS